MMKLRGKISSALRNKAGLGGLFNPMQEEADVIMAVVKEELGKLHEPVRIPTMGQTRCGNDGHLWPCPTMMLMDDE